MPVTQNSLCSCKDLFNILLDVAKEQCIFHIKVCLRENILRILNVNQSHGFKKLIIMFSERIQQCCNFSLHGEVAQLVNIIF